MTHRDDFVACDDLSPCDSGGIEPLLARDAEAFAFELDEEKLQAISRATHRTFVPHRSQHSRRSAIRSPMPLGSLRRWTNVWMGGGVLAAAAAVVIACIAIPLMRPQPALSPNDSRDPRIVMAMTPEQLDQDLAALGNGEGLLAWTEDASDSAIDTADLIDASLEDPWTSIDELRSSFFSDSDETGAL